MKIHYRKPTLLEEMDDAIRDSQKPIDYFELTSEELNANYSHFDRSQQRDGTTQYSYKTIPIKVKQ
jgi:hypothetical protein